VDVGVYESLLTHRLRQQLADRIDLVPHINAVDDAEHAVTLARHLTPIIERSLKSVGGAEARAQLVDKILAVLDDPEALEESLYQDDVAKIKRLDALAPNTLGAPQLPRPTTPLSDAALLTNARNDPTLAAELRAELASADRVDLLCAFVKWHGLRLLERELTELRERGVPLRVITTTYLGATDARALDRLVNEFGAEVRVNYETDRTRLHAKPRSVDRPC